MLFAKAAWRIPRPRPVQFLGEPIEWVDTARYLGMTLDFTPDLAASYRRVQEESLPATRRAWLSPKQEKRPLHQERSSVV
jgi:hypothetical protein